jgi:hypothetical protein
MAYSHKADCQETLGLSNQVSKSRIGGYTDSLLTCPPYSIFSFVRGLAQDLIRLSIRFCPTENFQEADQAGRSQPPLTPPDQIRGRVTGISSTALDPR